MKAKFASQFPSVGVISSPLSGRKCSVVPALLHPDTCEVYRFAGARTGKLLFRHARDGLFDGDFVSYPTAKVKSGHVIHWSLVRVEAACQRLFNACAGGEGSSSSSTLMLNQGVTVQRHDTVGGEEAAADVTALRSGRPRLAAFRRPP